jgi:hypothetical protein
LSIADMNPNSRMFWNVRAMPSAAMRLVAQPVMSVPSKATRPALGV